MATSASPTARARRSSRRRSPSASEFCCPAGRVGSTAHTAGVPTGPPLTVPLPFVPPLHPDNLFGHLAATAVPGVEEWRDGAYRATLRLPAGPAVAALRPPAPGSATLTCTLWLTDVADAHSAVATLPPGLDLDADPPAGDAPP